MGNTCKGCLRDDRSNTDSAGVVPEPKGQSTYSSHENSISEESKLLRRGTRQNKKKRPLVDGRCEEQGVVEAATAVVSQKTKSQTDIQLIYMAFSNHFILRNLEEETIESVVEKMNHYSIGSRQVIFEQNQPANSFYVLVSGKLEVIVNGVKQNVIKPGTGFGELALIDDRPRSATIKTITRSTLWGVDRKTFKDAVAQVNAMNYQENCNFIYKVPLFENLTEDQKEGLLAALTTQKWAAGEKIVKEGDTGDLFYMIKEGEVLCSQKGKEIRRMSKGEFFGEQALLYNSTRTATISTVDEVKVLSIARDQLMEVLGNNLQQILYRNSQLIAIERSSVLKNLFPEQRDKFIDACKIVNYSSGDIVIPKSTPKNQKIWILLKGKVSAGSKTVNVFDCIGAQSVFKRLEGKYSLDYVAEEDCDVSEISYDEIEARLGGLLGLGVNSLKLLNALKKVQILRTLTQESLESLVRAIRLVEFSNNQEIVRQNDPGNTLFIIKNGNVDIYKDNNKVRSMTKLDYFGERSVLFNENRTATVVANGKVICWMLQSEDFIRIIDTSITAQLMKRIELQDDTITMEELIGVKSIGKGMFGNVYLCMHKKKKTLYALKSISRKKIASYSLYENLLLEKRILNQLDHVMILKLVKTFKDSERVYFLTEFVMGLDLFDVLRKLGVVSEADSKFYTGCLILILEHLHERNIIYRDLKPENIMIDEEGYPKLIDFGTAKILQGRTYTTLGTPHYMAPEVILGKGYGLAADWWSLGVMLYEFLFCKVPLGDEEDDPYAIYQKILEHRLVFPPLQIARSLAKPLIEQLLSKNPAARTGGSVNKLKASKWFSDLDWNKLLCKHSKTPYIPRLNALTSEINKAFVKSLPVQTLVNRSEASEPNPPKRQRSKAPPSNWDSEF